VGLLDDDRCHNLLRLLENVFAIKKPRNLCVMCVHDVSVVFSMQFRLLQISIDGCTSHLPVGAIETSRVCSVDFFCIKQIKNAFSLIVIV
jgi:hypothetical protein